MDKGGDYFLCPIQFNIFNRSEVLDILQYFNELYPQNEECYIKIFSKKTKKSQFYNVKQLRSVESLTRILNYFGKEDLFISTNVFRSSKRATEGNIFSVNTIAVDVDYKKQDELKDLEVRNIIKLLELDYFKQSIPIPTYIEHSNQLRLIYKLAEPVYIPKYKTNARTLCNRVSEFFATALLEYGAEKQKVEKFLRVPHSINTKTGDIVQLAFYQKESYYLKELQEMWLNDLPDWYETWKEKSKEKPKKKKKKNPPFNASEFNLSRLADLERYQYYLNEKGINDYRHRLCFLIHNYWILYYKTSGENGDIYKKAKEKMLLFNEKFNFPLREYDIISETRCLKNKQYLYKDRTLMDFLDLTQEVCKVLHTEKLGKTKGNNVSAREYYFRNKEAIIEKKKAYNRVNLENIKDYQTEYYKKNKDKRRSDYQIKLKQENKLSKSEEKERIKSKVKVFLAEGLLQKQIAYELNLSLSTVKRYISQIKKEEEL